MRPVMTGIAFGLVGAFALSRVLSAMLFVVSPTDVATYAIACGGLAIAALLASVIPARRALGIDPISAVRGQ
jgi:putative ABC transport system permease protein